MDNPAKITVLNRGSGPHILLTAGSDGDEYDGIEAAKEVIKDWKRNPHWKGVRMILPVINELGYAVGVSYDPVSGIFPKHTIPSFWTSLTVRPDLWIDLHGGHRNESLTPFVWGFPHGSRQIKTKTINILHSLSDTTTVYSPWYKAAAVASLDCVYIVCESGELGVIDPVSIAQHLRWIEEIIFAYDRPVQTNRRHIEHLQYLSAEGSGYWQPRISKKEQVTSGQELGHLISNRSRISCIAKTEGIVLWHHRGGWVKAHENLGAIGKYS